MNIKNRVNDALDPLTKAFNIMGGIFKDFTDFL
jgi:hypothetical protein